jgi:hypothetical protein
LIGFRAFLTSLAQGLEDPRDPGLKAVAPLRIC